MATKKTPAGHINSVVAMDRSQYGNPTPSIHMSAPDLHHRKFSAALHRMAATVEMLTPEKESWILVIEQRGWHGKINLELITGTETEARRGKAILAKAVKTCKLLKGTNQ